MEGWRWQRARRRGRSRGCAGEARGALGACSRRPVASAGNAGAGDGAAAISTERWEYEAWLRRAVVRVADGRWRAGGSLALVLIIRCELVVGCARRECGEECTGVHRRDGEENRGDDEEGVHS